MAAPRDVAMDSAYFKPTTITARARKKRHEGEMDGDRGSNNNKLARVRGCV